MSIVEKEYEVKFNDYKETGYGSEMKKVFKAYINHKTVLTAECFKGEWTFTVGKQECHDIEWLQAFAEAVVGLNIMVQSYKEVATFLEKRNIVVFKEKMNVILIKTDESCEMAMVLVNDEMIMCGNEWDFNNGCHGFELPEFNDYHELAEIFEQFFKSAGFKSKIKFDNKWKFKC